MKDSLREQARETSLEGKATEYDLSSPRWPNVIGIASVVLAFLDTLAGLCGATGSILVDMVFLSRENSLTELQPPFMTWSIAGSLLARIALNVVLILTGAMLLRHRKAAVPLGKTWALAALIYNTAYLVSLPALSDAVGQSANGLLPRFTAWFLCALWQWLPPTFMLIWLSRRNTEIQVAKWN